MTAGKDLSLPLIGWTDSQGVTGFALKGEVIPVLQCGLSREHGLRLN
jgi:hypothetical protein